MYKNKDKNYAVIAIIYYVLYKMRHWQEILAFFT